VSGTTAKVVKPDGTLAGIGEKGELYIRGPQIALGYYLNDEA
jgi:4-coumarate--CoA ligase